MFKLARMLIFLLISLIVTFNCFAGDDDIVGEKAPDIFVKEWVTQNPPQVKNLDGKVYAVEFWATWCSPCVKNIPHLKQLNKKYQDDGLVMIALSQDRSTKKVKKMVEDKKINYNVAMDKGSVDWYKVKSYPTAYVIDHKGKVTWQGFPWKQDFEKAIAMALKKSK